MTCGNPIKHKIRNMLDNLFDMLIVERKLTGDQMECMQFGICDYAIKNIRFELIFRRQYEGYLG